MFTGIIEAMGKVEDVRREGTNLLLTLSCSFAHELKPDQSLAHNGVCLTVTAVSGNLYNVTLIDETLKRSALGELKKGDLVNLERCLRSDGRFDGHIVQGHVDKMATCTQVKDLNGSFEYYFEFEDGKNNLTVEKGSITVNGVSLTVVKSADTFFSVHIIPFTFENTGFRYIHSGTRVNIEFDIVGKYVARLLEFRGE